MFRINLKIAWRNLRRNGIYTVTNIGGLAIGITAFLLTLLYQTHIANYDAWDPGFDNVYQVRFSNLAKDNSQPYLSPKMMPLLNLQVPEIEASSRVYFGNSSTLLRIGENKFYEEDIVNVDSTFFDVFPFALKEGNKKTALQDLNSVVISSEMAEKYFKGKDPIGQRIRYDEVKDYTVTGVLARPAGPTRTKINALMRIVVPGWAGWGNFQYINYIKVNPRTDLTGLGNKMTKVWLGAAYDEMKSWEGWPASLQTFLNRPDHDRLVLMPISKVWVYENKRVIVILSLLSSIILIVACINFINQTVANADSRAREIGVRKVMGGLRGSLAIQFLMETFMQCLFAIFLALILVELFLPAYNSLTDEQIDLLAYCTKSLFLMKLTGTLLGVTILSGMYPAFYLSAFQPARVLKGNFDRGSGGQALRKVLLCLQFTFSLAFVISLLIISRQTSYMRNFKTGFDIASLNYIQMQEPATTRKFEEIKRQLLTIPHVRGAALCDYLPWHNGGNGDVLTYNNKDTYIREIRAGYGYMAAIGVGMAEGREFSSQYPADSTNGIILNEAAVKALSIPVPSVGQIVTYRYNRGGPPMNYRIVGVVKDFMLEDFSKKTGPTVFLNQNNYCYMIALNLDPHYRGQTMARIANLWKSVEPAHPIVFTTLEDDFKKVTESYARLQRIVSLFAIVTISIALIGLLALVAYNLKRRMKEIGIRQVVGASLTDILSMVHREFLFMLLLANVLAWLIAYLLMSRFLNNFVYRIPMPWELFPFVTLISLVAALTLISGRAWKAIHTMPAEILKYE